MRKEEVQLTTETTVERVTEHFAGFFTDKEASTKVDEHYNSVDDKLWYQIKPQTSSKTFFYVT